MTDETSYGTALFEDDNEQKKNTNIIATFANIFKGGHLSEEALSIAVMGGGDSPSSPVTIYAERMQEFRTILERDILLTKTPDQ